MAKLQGVRTQHPDYVAMAPVWRMCRDASDGEIAVHAAGTRYLPKLRDEATPDYDARLGRTPFFNATWRTIAGLSGMMLRRPPTVEVPAGVDAYLLDVDMAGSPLDQYVQELAVEALTVGRVGLLVDHPAADSGAVPVAQAERMGLRPAMHVYPAESIYNWKTERVNNALVLSVVRLSEEAELPGETEFDRVTETRYRVLDLNNGVYRQRVYRINEKGGDELISEFVPLMNGRPMPYIPFVVIGVDGISGEVDYPPLIDVITLNMHHYQVSADYEHGCHISGLPTLFISGYHPGANSPTIYLGGPAANCLPDPQAKAYYVESAANFEALRLNLEDKVRGMAILGARMLEAQKASAETQDTVAQHRKGEESLLAAMAQTLSQGVQRALEWFAAWAGKSGPVQFDISRDFMPSRMSPQELTAMLAAWQAGMPGYSSEAIYARLQARDEVNPDVTFEEEQARVENAGPQLANGSNPNV